LKAGSPPQGAVMLAGLALMAVLASVIFALSRSAVVSTDKARSMAIADASAKSVATWYAQVLNYDAYTNRAIAANEIMMAQAVTMVAWTQYVEELAQNIGTVAALIPALQPVATWVQQVSSATHQLTTSGALVEVPLRSAYTRALQSSQSIMHSSANAFSAQALVNEVVWTGDPRFFGQLITSTNPSTFFNFTKNFTGVDRADFASLLRDTQDSYSRQRGYNQRLYLMPTVTCIPRNLDQAFSRLTRRGGTWLTADMTDWESADTLSIHTWRRRSRWNPTCGGTGEAIPLGWGAAEAGQAPIDGINEDPAGVRINPSAWNRARAQAVSIPGYLGLTNHRELTDITQQARRDAVIRVPVLVRLDMGKVAKIKAGRTVFDAKAAATEQSRIAPLGDAIWSLGVAETYFLRPPDTLRGPSEREFANLFAPFWESRLVPASSIDRTVAIALAQARGNK
jgi:hypothetical protein